jgi:flagella basal body P-ring formation protein FlgA
VRLQKGTGVSVRWDRPPHPGKSWITVWLRPPGKTEDRAMLVRIDLAERQSVVVVRRTVAAGNPISADDLAPAFRAVDGALEVSPEAIAGAVARIELSPGHVVRAGDVELPPPVARGTMVTVRVQSPGVSVSASGRLEQTARPGEEVAVRVEATLRVLQGRLVGPSLVLVEGGPR